MDFMKAVVYEKYGPPDVLQVKMVEKPVPGDDDVLIKIRAAEVTKADCEMRSLDFQVNWLRLPMRLALGFAKPKKPILGGYFSGEVASVGSKVSGLKIGDPVFGAAKLRLGAHAEYICLPAGYTIVSKPQTIGFEEAAAVPLGALNAIHFLRRATIQKGEAVLVNGAGGSIGVYGIQIAKAWGAEVTAVDAPHKENLLRRMGADHFLDHTKEDFARCGRRWDVIFNMVARRSFTDCMHALNPKGRYLMANPKLSDMLRSWMLRLHTDKKAIFAFAGETREELTAIREMIETGRLKPVVDRIYPFDQAAQAHRRVQTENRLGGVVVSI